MGRGHIVVRAAHWLTHISRDLESPVWRHWLVHALAARKAGGCSASRDARGQHQWHLRQCLCFCSFAVSKNRRCQATPIWAVLYIAVFASATGFLFWTYGISVVGPERGGQFVHLMPVFGSVLAVLLLGEQVTVTLVAGAAGVVTGIILVNLRQRPTSRQPT
ncbi:DMT family transporter [Pukyongiella litopenaei]